MAQRSERVSPAPTDKNGEVRKDPTDVVGLRVAAYAIDALIITVLMFIGFSATSEATTVEGQNICDAEPVDNGQGGEAAVEVNGDTICFYVDNDQQNESVRIEYNVAALAALPALYMVGAVWLLQGLTGATPGKLACGLRVVDKDGRTCGIGRSIVRSLLWVVDGLPGLCFCLFAPLVGFIAMLVSKQHRRVGDMAAKTWVVKKDSMGVALGGPHHQAYGSSPWGGAPGDPNLPPSSAPDGQGAPQWDEARRAWIQYSPTRGQWLQHDPSSSEWRGIS